MSSSDPTSNFDSLNISSESMDIPAAWRSVVSKVQPKCVSSKVQPKCVSTPRRARSKSLQRQGQGSRNVSQVINNMPKAQDSGGHLAAVSTGHGVGSEPNHRSCLRTFLPGFQRTPDLYSQHLRIS